MGAAMVQQVDSAAGGEVLPGPLSGDTVLSVRGLVKTFTLHARGQRIEAVQGVSFDVAPGRFTALVGNSGAGKSSILKCVYRTYVADSGSIHYRTASGEAIELARAAEQRVLELRDREIGMVTQFLHVLPRQTTEEVVAGPLRHLGVSRGEALERARAMLSAVGLPQRLWTIEPATFSGGERQLVNLGRALVVKPRLLLLDEPTASLDARHAEGVIDAIQRLRDGGVAMIGVFHHRASVERLADTVIRVAGGLDSEPAEGTA